MSENKNSVSSKVKKSDNLAPHGNDTAEAETPHESLEYKIGSAAIFISSILLAIHLTDSFWAGVACIFGVMLSFLALVLFISAIGCVRVAIFSSKNSPDEIFGMSLSAGVFVACSFVAINISTIFLPDGATPQLAKLLEVILGKFT